MESLPHGWMSMLGAERYAGLNHAVISRAVHSGELPAYRVGRSYRIAVSDIDAWIRTFPSAAEVDVNAS